MTDVMDKPVYLLTSEDLDALPHPERQWAINHIAFLKETGTLALILANPKNTTYETVWQDGRWRLKPLPRLDPLESVEAMRQLVREEFDAAVAKLNVAPAQTAGERS